MRESFPQEFPRLPITPRTENYAQVPLKEGFDVIEILGMASEFGQLSPGHKMYLVDFASKIKPGADYGRLIELDDAAHREAAASEGFLLYYRGDLDPEGYSRSFCVWSGMPEAKLATKKIAHHTASQAAEEMYSTYEVTMREAWLEPTDIGFGFGIEVSHSYSDHE